MMQIMSWNQDAVLEPGTEILFWWGGKERIMLKEKVEFILKRAKSHGLQMLCHDPTDPTVYDGGEYTILSYKESIYKWGKKYTDMYYDTTIS